jgi:hypothetical protein
MQAAHAMNRYTYKIGMPFKNAILLAALRIGSLNKTIISTASKTNTVLFLCSSFTEFPSVCLKDNKKAQAVVACACSLRFSYLSSYSPDNA